MKKSDLHKHVDPEVVEMLRGLYDAVVITMASMNDLIASQHYEAATIVGKRLGDVSNDFRQAMHELQLAAERHQADVAALATMVATSPVVQLAGEDKPAPGSPEAPPVQP